MRNTVRSVMNSLLYGVKRGEDRRSRLSKDTLSSRSGPKWRLPPSERLHASHTGPTDPPATGSRSGVIKMSVTIIDTNNRRRAPSPAGTVRQIVTSDDRAKDLRAAIHDIAPGKAQEFNSESRSHLLYVLEGEGGQFSFKGQNHIAKR